MTREDAIVKMKSTIRKSVIAGLNKPLRNMFGSTSLVDERNKGFQYFKTATVGRKIISDFADRGVIVDVFMIRGLMKDKEEAVGNWVEPDYVMCVKWKDILMYVCILDEPGRVLDGFNGSIAVYIDEKMPEYFNTKPRYLMRCMNLFERKEQNLYAVQLNAKLKAFHRKENYEFK